MANGFVTSQLFRVRRSMGVHRKSKVNLGRFLAYLGGAIGDQLYYIGATQERMFSNFRRKYRKQSKVVKTQAKTVATSAGTGLLQQIFGVVKDLFAPFIKVFSALFSSISVLREMKGRPWRMKKARMAAFLRYGLKWNREMMERFFSYLLPAVCGVLCFFTVFRVLNLNYGIGIEYNGQNIGVVANESIYDSAVKIIDDRMQQVSPSTRWAPQANLTIAVSSTADMATQDVIANRLLAASGTEVVEATGLYVGGTFYGATTAKDLMQQALDDVIEPYRTYASTLGDDVTVRFSREVELIDGVYPADSVLAFDTLESLVKSDDAQDIYYYAKAGELVAQIAESNGITLDELRALNPEALLDRDELLDDTALLVAQSESIVTVKTIRTVVSTERIAFRTIVTRDSNYDVGYYWLASSGENGEKTITTEIEYENGVEVSRTVVSEKITKEPVPQEIVIGQSGSGGASVGSGSLTWPTGPYQFISRGFTPGGHGGMDIAAQFGTPVYAADSGVVITSVDTEVGYGHYIVLDHQNNMTTVYGHLSVRLVSVGEVVQRGQIIGLVGSTGNSTGNHLHFETRIGGVRVAPEIYLYG